VDEASDSQSKHALWRQSFTSFTFFFYGLELLATFVAFGLGTCTHFGYMFDTILLAVVTCAQSYGFGTECRLLGVYRIWRVARLVTYLVDQERAAHAETQQLLQEKEEELLASKATVLRLETEVKSEQEARRAVESTLRQYKDEVDLLHEALHEAAKDVAIAGMEAELEEDEEEGDDEQGDEQQEAGTQREAHETQQQQQQQEGPANDEQKSTSTTRSSTKSNNKKHTPRRGPQTVIIHEDGSFEKH
jgi:hypothetical protein